MGFQFSPTLFTKSRKITKNNQKQNKNNNENNNKKQNKKQINKNERNKILLEFLNNNSNISLCKTISLKRKFCEENNIIEVYSKKKSRNIVS